MNLLQRVVNIRSGGRTERCHTVPHHGSYSNAAHQWGVAMLMWELWPDDYPRLSIFCLTHDVPEKWFGDTPATAKKYIDGLAETIGEMEDQTQLKLGLPVESDLSDSDYTKLKNCDYLELYMWCIEQLQMGNGCVREILNSLEDFFQEKPLLPVADALLTDIRKYGVATYPQRFRELIITETAK